MSIKENFQKIKREIPDHVTVVVAAKARTSDEIREVIDAGATDIGENYLQEGERMVSDLGDVASKVRWHMIGDLQTNKINKALKVFDTIQTIGSYDKAEAINKRVQQAGKDVVPVYIEINVGGEISKSGIPADEQKVTELAVKISEMSFLRLEGIMTIGPLLDDPGSVRPFFKQVKDIYDKVLKLNLKNTNLRRLSMGMSSSYKAAIEEGANMVRIGTAIFGPRSPR